MTQPRVLGHSIKPPEGGPHDTAIGMDMNRSTANIQPPADTSARTFALVAAFGLLVMAVLAPIAQFGVLATLIVPADASATATRIAGSLGAFGGAIAAFLAVAILDVIVAFALYVLLRPVNRSLALVVTALRVVYAAVFAVALLNLWNVVQLVGSSVTAAPSAAVTSQVTGSIASFHNVWDIGLAIFGLHLVGLGGLLIRAPSFGRVIGALVVIAGLGYAVDSFGRLFVADYSLTLSMFTFVGEALLIVWLFRLAIRGSRAPDSQGTLTVAERASEPVVATS
jgi:Domain of unknown function (DUF4386)